MENIQAADGFIPYLEMRMELLIYQIYLLSYLLAQDSSAGALMGTCYFFFI